MSYGEQITESRK